MKTKQLIAISLCGAMALALSACGGSSQATTTTAAAETTSEEVTTVEETTEAVVEDVAFEWLPEGTYVYVDHEPEAQEENGEVQFVWDTDTLNWAIGEETGSQLLTGDVLEMFESLYLSDRPVTDWLGGSLKDVEGYASYVADSFTFDINEDGLLSHINLANFATRVTVVLSDKITAPQLMVHGATRGQPNLMQSCITLVGSTNGLYLTKQGDVIMDNLKIGCDENGLGLSGDKIGGDTFVVGTVTVDGTVEWCNLRGVITALDSQPGTLATNGQDIHMTGGTYIGRVGREFNITTGEDLGGDIIIGDVVTSDATRGGLLPDADTSYEAVQIGTTGSIIAGKGDVIIGGNETRACVINIMGDIQGNNVTIHPLDYGNPAKINVAIGNIEAEGDVDIVVSTINDGEAIVNVSQSSAGAITTTGNTDIDPSRLPDKPVGNITSANGNISFKADLVVGEMGEFSAPNGTVTVEIAQQQ